MTFDLTLAGTSVKTYAQIAEWDGILSGAPHRGSNVLRPSVRGQQFAPKPFDAYDFSVPLVLLGTSQADFQDRLSSLRALCDSTVASVAVGRTIPTGAGDLTTACAADVRISEVGVRNGMLTGKVVLEVTNLDGCWYGSVTNPTIPATITVGGNTRTNRISLTLPGAGTLTNTTLGVSVTVTAAQTITVLTRTTTGSLSTISAAGDPLGNLFALAPGSNVITWSAAGTPTMGYWPAYQ